MNIFDNPFDKEGHVSDEAMRAYVTVRNLRGLDAARREFRAVFDHILGCDHCAGYYDEILAAMEVAAWAGMSPQPVHKKNTSRRRSLTPWIIGIGLVVLAIIFGLIAAHAANLI